MNHTYEPIIEALKADAFKEAERLSVDALRLSPLEAQLWVYLGEALLHQGSGLTAAKVFRRAHLLDPQAAWAGVAQAALKHASPGDERIDIEVMLDVDKVTVAAALLVRNEIRCIERCLHSLAGAVDEIVVIDTGSTDGTREAAAAIPGVKIVDFTWCDDFAAARNSGLPFIESDWVMWVDADEWLLQEDAGNIREAAGLFTKHNVPCILHGGTIEKIGDRTQVNYAKGNMFPLKQKNRYWGRIHEQIVPPEGGIYAGQYLHQSVLIRLLHDGYDPTVMQQKDKLIRNLKLLVLMLQEEPENPAWWLFYGRETLGTGDKDKALQLLLKAEDLASAEPRFSRMLEVRMLLASIYLSDENLVEAEAVCRRALEAAPNFPDALFHLSQIETRKAFVLLQNAEKHLHESQAALSAYRGAVTADYEIGLWKADFALADLTRSAGKLADARDIYRKILQKQPKHPSAEKRLAQIEEQRKLLNENQTT